MCCLAWHSGVGLGSPPVKSCRDRGHGKPIWGGQAGVVIGPSACQSLLLGPSISPSGSSACTSLLRGSSADPSVAGLTEPPFASSFQDHFDRSSLPPKVRASTSLRTVLKHSYHPTFFVGAWLQFHIPTSGTTHPQPRWNEGDPLGKWLVVAVPLPAQSFLSPLRHSLLDLLRTMSHSATTQTRVEPWHGPLQVDIQLRIPRPQFIYAARDFRKGLIVCLHLLTSARDVTRQEPTPKNNYDQHQIKVSADLRNSMQTTCIRGGPILQFFQGQEKMRGVMCSCHSLVGRM